MYGWAGLSGTSNGLVMNGTRIQLKNTTNCLTAITCVKGSNSWCDSTVTQQVLKESDAQSGSYLMFKDCYGTTAVSQQFLIDPPCAVNCTKDMQNNKVCDAACNTTYCYWDNGYCNNTQTPTLSPTRKNTIGTLAPSSSSDSPTAAPKVNPPIPSSHPTSFIRNPTTYQSTTQPTSSTSVAEGPYFVATYVLLSLCLLFLFLFLLFAYLYWQSKKTAAAHVD